MRKKILLAKLPQHADIKGNCVIDEENLLLKINTPVYHIEYRLYFDPLKEKFYWFIHSINLKNKLL